MLVKIPLNDLTNFYLDVSIEDNGLSSFRKHPVDLPPSARITLPQGLILNLETVPKNDVPTLRLFISDTQETHPSSTPRECEKSPRM